LLRLSAVGLLGLTAVLSHAKAPLQPSQTLGAFLTPIDAWASSAQAAAGRTPRRLIDGSGWGETFPGSGVYVHTNDISSDGTCMWNGDPNSWLVFDLGKSCRVNGVYIWNYNESGGWSSRGVKDAALSVSADGKQFRPMGTFHFAEASGQDDDPGQAIPFPSVVSGRYFKLHILSNYRGGESSGLAEVRFSNAAAKPLTAGVVVWKPQYIRLRYLNRPLGQPLPSQENIVYPADAGVVNVTQAPYFAHGDGKTDDTAAIQKALDDHPSQGAIIYLPNGIYLISDTLHWPHGNNPGGEERETVLQGQSRAGTVLQLRDYCPGFGSARHPKAPLRTGLRPAQRFGNEIHNLTVDTGIGNPGACGIQFIANNQGGVYDVSIVSGDGQGVIGLDMGYTDEQGPCLIKNVRVRGFDLGVHVATSVASETLEHILVEYQNKAGIRNDGQPCTVRDLQSVNSVPAFVAAGGFSVLTGAHLHGIGAASAQAAVVAEAPLYAGDIQTSGYRLALAGRIGEKRDLAGPNIPVFLSKPTASLFGSPGPPLDLPVRETPEAPWDTPSAWATPQKFGLKTEDSQDASAAIQQAIDSGATTVYLPRGDYKIGHTINIRGRVRRIVGCKANFDIIAPLSGLAQPVFRFAEGTMPVVTLEGINTDFSSGPFFFIDDTAARSLVLRRLAINFQGADAFHGQGPGTVFLEDVVGRYFRFHHQTVWARQFNPEGDGLHVLNDGGTLWILGLKTEGGGTLLETRNRGRTELLGGFAYATEQGKLGPMFVVENSQAAFTFSEVCYSGDPFATLVRETQGGETREIKMTSPEWGDHFTLFTSGEAER
jgi:hypothetical protein